MFYLVTGMLSGYSKANYNYMERVSEKLYIGKTA